jgi:hypothetical protein
MSDYGDDDYLDFEEEWFYVEDEYTAADDLAEHAVGSPPPASYMDDDGEDWDRFDYFNDLEYASDGYDDAQFESQGNAIVGHKRKRGVGSGQSKKLRKRGDGRAVAPNSAGPVMPPVVWRAQADREADIKVLEDGLEPYALLSDWRERLADTPAWATGSPKSKASGANGKAVQASELEPLEDEEDSEAEEDGAGIDSGALMAALQKNLAAAGGPLSDMDPQQLLQFAMRMMDNQDAGDDIAGELADDLFGQGNDGEEDEEGADAELLSWLERQKVNDANDRVSKTDGETPASPDVQQRGERPPTPPSSEANRSVRAPKDPMEADQIKSNNAAALKRQNHSLEITQEVSRKRKADEDVEAGPSTAPKRRAAKSYNAPTAASQAKAAPSKSTRARAKRT